MAYDYTQANPAPLAYDYTQANPAPSPPASLVGDGVRVIERLTEIHHRVTKLGDMLHGTQPRDAGGPIPQTVEPPATVRRNLDRSHNLLGDIENELSRIEGRL